MSILNLVRDNRKYKFKCSITHERTDVKVMYDLFSAIKDFKQALKKHKRESLECKFLAAKIKEFRTLITQENAWSVIVYKVSLGSYYNEYVYSEYPEASVIKDIAFELVDKLKEKRKSHKDFKDETREYLGFSYKMRGSVFTENNAVLKLNNFENGMKRIAKAKKPVANSKSNYIGVELELISKLDKKTLESKLVEAGLAGYAYVKHDGSIRKEEDKEYVHEITLLIQEIDYVNIIKRVCVVLNTKDYGNYVNNSCGMHVHFDMRNRDANVSYKNLFNILPVLTKIVPNNRLHAEPGQQNYCQVNSETTFEKQLGRERYYAINAQAHRSHGTLEVRLHSGTMNAAKIINWITICLKALNHTESFKLIETIDDYASVFGITTKLKEYMVKRAELFATKKKEMDTRSDHFFINDLEIAVA